MSADPLEMIEGYQASAMVAAAVRTGVADALAAGALRAEEIASACHTDPRATSALLGALAANGLVQRVASAGAEEARWSLSAAGAPLATSHPRSIVKIVEKEWFFYRAWAGLEQAVRDGRARIPPWEQRLEANADESLDFLRALDDLAERFGGELASLAGELGAARVLDVGGGAGSHAARLQAENPDAAVHVLDLPAIEPVLRERHGEIAFLAGDLRDPRFGRPDGEQWDVVLLANILHDQTPERATEILRQATALLVPGGTVILYEWILDETRDSPPAVAMFALMMLVENEGGGAYTFAEISAWLGAAALVSPQLRRGQGPIAVVSAKKRSP